MSGRTNPSNILLATELIKKYNTKNISPRFMLKIDLKKACDSIVWSFLETVMREVSLPTQFLKWVMTCVTFVSLFILINGVPCKPFPAQ